MDLGTGTGESQRFWLTNIAIVSAGALISSLAVSSINVSLHTIADDLHTGIGIASASVIVYLLVLSGLFLFFGKLGDVWGYRRVFLAGTAVFTIASVLCGAAGTVSWLILFRAFQAAGAAMVTSIGPAFVTRHVPREWHGRGLAYVSGAAVLGVILGPSIGVAITNLAGGSWIFYLNVPVGAAILAIGWFTLPAENDTAEGRRFDLTGACLFSLASITLVLAISSIHVFSPPTSSRSV